MNSKQYNNNQALNQTQAGGKNYPEVSSSPNFPEIETKIIKYWQQNNIFKKSVDINPKLDKSGNNSNEFVFYDGPPFANGLPHYGHLLTGYVKDIFARYQTMLGKKVERRFGWDCHGLPAEMGAEKELAISGRAAIEKFGIDKFNEVCRSSVMKYTSEWENYVNRQARWVDFKNDYKTMDVNYMESVIWAFKQLWDKGLVYESMRVMPYSWACETPLSNFETRMDNAYRERVDKAATVAFLLDAKPKSAPIADRYYLCAWTTTPWTLPSNLALAVNAGITYGYYYLETRPHDCFILSSQAAAKYESIGLKAFDDNASVKGAELAGALYTPLFPFFTARKNSGAFKVLTADFVTDTDGTGVVHIAPGFGEDDFNLCKEAGIELVCPVDNAGKFIEPIYDITENGSMMEGPLSPLGERDGVRGQIINAKATLNTDTANKIRNDKIIENARSLRKSKTKEESLLWTELRARRFSDYKFRRQHDIGNYIVDFICLELGLVIELDGSGHADKATIVYDTKRSEYLAKRGYNVIRFWNSDIHTNFHGVLESIYHALEDLKSGKGIKDVSYLVPGSFSVADIAEQNVLTPHENILTPHPVPLPGGGEGTHQPSAGSGQTLQLKGRNVLETNDDIIKYLKTTGAWLKTEQYIHNYPHCWRTDTPLIYKAVPSWYVAVSKFKDRMVELNQQINWIPSHVKDGQFGKWLENAHDWSISRNRYWGSPIPVWKSDNPNSKQPLIAFGSIAELEEFFSAKVTDLHRPFIDQLVKEDDAEQPENPRYYYRRVTDVFDCWFESGSMPYAQAHYPFENKDWFEHHFPADFIVEYVAQTRGWFYTLMVLATALFDRPPFLNVICHGVVLDAKGQKLSKRLNNYADPMDIFDRFGADAMRFVMISAPIMHGGELLIDKEGNMIKDAVRLVIKPIWNAYNFFTLYANADLIAANFVTAYDNLLDKYILAKCKAAVVGIKKALDNFDTPEATKAIEQFFEVLNNWYIRRNKERFWKSQKDADKQAAYDCLYTVQNIMCRAMAPLLPLLAEEIFLGLNQGKESVHLEKFPDVSMIDDAASLIKDMDLVRDVCNVALAIRSSENIRVRQPLSKLDVVGYNVENIKPYSDLIKDELNIKNIVIHAAEKISDFGNFKLQIIFPVLGKRLKQDGKEDKMKLITTEVRNGNWQKNSAGQLVVAGEVLYEDEYKQILESKTPKNSGALSSNSDLVVLDLNVTEELKIEGLYRDLIRLIQQSRKDADLRITDKIKLYIVTQDAEIKTALTKFSDEIKAQTLAESLELTIAPESARIFNLEIEDKPVIIGIL